MSLMLKRGIEVLLGVALAVAIFAVLPAVAEAQSRAATQETQSAKRDAAAASVVVRPGDSLWSISAEQLGPNATPRQIANTVERIYALNRNQIGADPDLIFPGQQLLVPQVAERAVVERRGATKSISKESAAKPAQASAERPAAHKEAATRPGSDAAASSVEAEPVVLPDLPAKEVGLEVGSLPAKDPHASLVETFTRSARAFGLSVASTVIGALGEDGYLGRRLLGLAILALSFGVALLLAWRWYARRQVDRRLTWQARGINNYNFFDPMDPSVGFGHAPKPPLGAPGRSRGDFAGNTAGGEQAPGYAVFSAAARKRRILVRLARKARPRRRLLSGGDATRAYNPEIRRSLRRAPAVAAKKQKNKRGGS